MPEETFEKPKPGNANRSEARAASLEANAPASNCLGTSEVDKLRALAAMNELSDHQKNPFVKLFDRVYLALKRYELTRQDVVEADGLKICKRKDGRLEIHLPNDRPFVWEAVHAVPQKPDTWITKVFVPSPIVVDKTGNDDVFSLKATPGDLGASTIKAFRWFSLHERMAPYSAITFGHKGQTLTVRYVSPEGGERQRQVWPLSPIEEKVATLK